MFVVLYTIRLTGPEGVGRKVSLVYSTTEGEQHSASESEQGDAERTDRGKTDHTGVITIWGPWSARVRVLVDGEEVAELTRWTERPADRYTELEPPPKRTVTGPAKQS